MALRPEDPSSGFRHSNVVAFINEKMARHTKGPEFYLENISLSWEEVEDKLWAILEDSEVPSEVKEACTWGSLALGVRFAHRQGQLQNRRVQWLQGFAKLHRLAAMVLASNLTEFKEQQEMECNKATFQLRITQTSLAEAQRERDKELASPRRQGQATVFPGLATARGDWTEGAGEQEKEAVAAAGAAEGEGEERFAEAGPAPEEALQGLGGGFRHPLGAVEQANYTFGGQREQDLRSAQTALSYFSGPGSTASLEPLPVQLPTSFTYSYPCPLSAFSAIPTIPPSPAKVTAPVPTQMPSNWGASDASLWSDVGAQGIDPQEPPRDRRDSEPHQQRRPPVYRRPGDWDCPWCKTVNFSRRENCFLCGRRIWLQRPQ
ncbi:testis-expressed protein 13B [Macaca mulatta]